MSKDNKKSKQKDEQAPAKPGGVIELTDKDLEKVQGGIKPRK